MSTNRRQFLKMMGIAITTPFVLHPLSSSMAATSAASTDDIFNLSVASGDPSASGVVLWTRINPEHYNSQDKLYFEVATDRDFSHIAYSGSVQASDFDSDRDYTVNLDLDGHLSAHSTYYYRFIYQGVYSNIGRAKTLPDEQSQIEQLKLAVITCQDFTTGYYNAFHYLADESLDFVIHLGDFIYEYAEYEGMESTVVRPVAMPSGHKVAMNLEDYRHIYRTYREDKNLQKAMENHTFIITWDDHETADNCYWDYDKDTMGAPHHPYHTYPEFSPNKEQLFRQLRKDAQQAWFEFVPARVSFNESADHPFDRLKLYRSFKFGNLGELFMTDSRTYRTQEPCSEGSSWDKYWCKDYTKSSQTMLGNGQKSWLVNGLTSSDAKWKIWGNQTLLAQLAVTALGRPLAYANYDAWDGYQHERTEIMEAVRDNQVDNLVVITGDMHTALTSYVKVDYKELSNWDYDNLVGVELMTPAISSPHLTDTIKHSTKANSGMESLINGGVQLNNPHIKDFNSGLYGYSILTLTQDVINWEVYQVDKYHAQPSGKSLYKRFEFNPDGFWLTEK